MMTLPFPLPEAVVHALGWTLLHSLWQGGEWHFAPTGPRTIHHCKGGVFFATGERIAAVRT